MVSKQKLACLVVQRKGALARVSGTEVVVLQESGNVSPRLLVVYVALNETILNVVVFILKAHVKAVNSTV